MKRLTPWLCLLLLTGCSGDPDAAASAEGAKPNHPWDWQPEDPELAAGRQVYLDTCGLCHNEGEQGATPLGSAGRWESRIAKGEATLIRHALEGFKGEDGKMPARGDNDALSDADVTAAVKFMIAAPK